jgi:hypothetical protein
LLTANGKYRPNENRQLRSKCACPTGWELAPDAVTCRDWTFKDSLVIANRTDVRILPLGLPYTTDIVLPVPCPMKNVVGVDVDSSTGEPSFLEIRLLSISTVNLLSKSFCASPLTRFFEN